MGVRRSLRPSSRGKHRTNIPTWNLLSLILIALGAGGSRTSSGRLLRMRHCGIAWCRPIQPRRASVHPLRNGAPRGTHTHTYTRRRTHIHNTKRYRWRSTAFKCWLANTRMTLTSAGKLRSAWSSDRACAPCHTTISSSRSDNGRPLSARARRPHW